MLQRDPKRRATAQQILQHDWMRENGVASDQAIEMEVLSRIRKFSAGNRLKKEAIKLIAANLPADEINGLHEMFMEMDVDKSGSISAEEFASALRRKGNQLPESDIQKIIRVSQTTGENLLTTTS
jgi:calcium-dependent protein kinase